MANAKDIKKRIKSVQSTRKITRTMELVSTSKMKRALDRVIAAQPYLDKLEEVLRDLAKAGVSISHPLLETREVKKVMIFLVTSNRGLCGGYNSNLIKKARDLHKQLESEGKEVSMTLMLKQSLTQDWLIPMESYDTLPTYFIYGGVVFCPLTKNLLKAWGPGWYGSAPKDWVSLVNNNHASDEIDEVVIALKVLAADVNEGYHKFSTWTIDKINGEKVKSKFPVLE